MEDRPSHVERLRPNCALAGQFISIIVVIFIIIITIIIIVVSVVVVVIMIIIMIIIIIIIIIIIVVLLIIFIDCRQSCFSFLFTISCACGRTVSAPCVCGG
jgi:hypothetical protein